MDHTNDRSPSHTPITETHQVGMLIADLVVGWAPSISLVFSVI